MPKNWDDFEDIVKSSNTEKEYETLSISSDFSSKLIKARLRRNYTQSDLAKRSGLKQSAIARIENQGSLPRIDTVYKLAKALDSVFDFYSTNSKEDMNFSHLSDEMSKLENLILDLKEEVRVIKTILRKSMRLPMVIRIVEPKQTLMQTTDFPFWDREVGWNSILPKSYTHNRILSFNNSCDYRIDE